MIGMLIFSIACLAAMAVLLVHYRSCRRRLDAEANRKAVERFQSLMMSYNEASRVAMSASGGGPSTRATMPCSWLASQTV